VIEMAENEEMFRPETAAEQLGEGAGRPGRIHPRTLSPQEIEARRLSRLDEGTRKLNVALDIIMLIRTSGWPLEDLPVVECIITRALGL